VSLEPAPSVPGGPRPLAVAVLLLLSLVPYAVELGGTPLWDANEPLYAEPPREALENGDWLAPTWNGKPWFVHPPLSSWVTMPFYAALGPTELAERVPMALAAALAVLAAASIARRGWGPRAGLVAGLLLATTGRFWLFARQLSADVYLTALLAWAFALALPALSEEGRRRGRLLAAHALASLAVLAKGPVALLLYAVPLVLAARLARPRVPLSRLAPLGLAACVVAIAAPWFAYMSWRFGAEFANEYFVRHHLQRSLSGELGSKPWWFLPVALLGDGLPWRCCPSCSSASPRGSATCTCCPCTRSSRCSWRR
jgi:4-amino-4-deoxy-L-arabinose transferase-like glycosyltransferase